jgi:phage regulator Rha-like protein
MKELIPAEIIENKIYLIRGQKVMLSMHLAELYGIETRALNQAVKRNIQRFPEDFMFQINGKEAEHLVSQNVIPHKKHFGGYLPYAFTEHGAIMLATVLNSPVAVQASIQVVRAFVKLREMLSANKELAHKLTLLENRIGKHDEDIKLIFNAIRQLMTSPEKPKRKIGFHRGEEKE